ncbi:DUF6634 family protein [Aestuariibius sp. 2305UL40-4]|uniref:DUF6634 family protein n=1 Tax=Aestuariibius violaceus TaxID=3234132 RepID=UPI00345EEBD7
MVEDEDLLIAVTEVRRGPTSTDLADAPELSDWRLEAHGRNLRLHGCVSGGKAKKKSYLTTSALVAFEPDAGWARTRSRWYRLAPSWLVTNPKEREEMIAETQSYLGRMVETTLRSAGDQVTRPDMSA